MNDETGLPEHAPVGMYRDEDKIPTGEAYFAMRWSDPIGGQVHGGYMTVRCAVECCLPHIPPKPSPEFEEKVEDAKKHFAEAGEDEIERIAQEKDKWK